MVNASSTLMRCTAALALLSGASAGAEPRVVTNTASVQWDVSGQTERDVSNTVRVLVEDTPEAPPNFDLLQLAPGGPVTSAVDGTRCGGGPIQTTFAGQPLAAAAVAPVTTLSAGTPLIISVNAPASNRDRAARDRLEVRVTAGGDRERFSLLETANDSGVFTGLVPTRSVPPPLVVEDCVLSLPADESTAISVARGDGEPFGSATITLRSDADNLTFDSATGDPVARTRLTLLAAATGAPAARYAADGTTVLTPAVESDAGGRFRLGVLPAGRYRVRIDPPAPYTAPSTVAPDALALVDRVTIGEASYGRDFTVSAPGAVRFDVPLDRAAAGLLLTKSVSQAVAQRGDQLLYTLTVTNADAQRSSRPVTITDTLPVGLRLIAKSVRASTGDVTTTSRDGRTIAFAVAPLARGESRQVRYLAEVRADAPVGFVVNRAQARDAAGVESVTADATVRIERDPLTDRMTIVGRITDGGCGVDPTTLTGVGGVRVVMEDGSFAVTDPDGRYHLDGVTPGTHVVQVETTTLPVGRIATDCARDTRSAGSATSRFVRGTGGALARADFNVAVGDSGQRLAARTVERPTVASDGLAAGGEGRDWLTDQTPGVEWLFPGTDDNPRARVVRVVVKHAPGQTVLLKREGQAVAALNFDGAQANGDGTVAVSSWRGLELSGRDTRFTAEVRDADGALVTTLTRTIHFAETPVRAQLLPDRSLLIADGVSRPVIAVRLTDGAGRPIHHGAAGPFRVPTPYLPAQEAEALQLRQLGGLERAPATWRIEGDDGVAYLELMPTTASGSLTVTLPFTDGTLTREDRLDLWLDPGDRPWTVVGLAEGSVGRAAIDGHIEPVEADRPLLDGRLALYAKGRVLGRWLLTASYDTDKQHADTRFGGAIDPTSYYTVYADGSERLFDAASIRKLYLKLERPQFAALFGDYQTGIDRPELTRYVRSFNGARAQFDNGRVAAEAFVADTAFRTQRAEIQGSGLSGPYNVGARDLVPNGERVVVEVRDRLRSNQVIESRELRRYLDYEIDYRTGALRFREPILSRDLGLNPQFIVVDFEADRGTRRVLNAGGRAGWTSADGRLEGAATVVHDRVETGATDIVGADVRFRPLASTEIRAELALSRGNAVGVPGSAVAGTANPGNDIRGNAVAWLVEAEHHVADFDLLAYARQFDRGFGVGQQNRSERASRKVGFDGRYRLTRTLSLTGSAYTERYLDTGARRIAAGASLDWQRDRTNLRAGLLFADDQIPGGSVRRSTLLETGLRQRISDRLELDATSHVALTKSDDSIDYPQRLSAGARWQALGWLDLIGSYERVTGGSVKADTARAGFEVRPWAGAKIAATGNQQSVAELGTRTYAAFGLAQSLPVTSRLTVDASLDANRTLGTFDRAAILNPDQPVATGGYLGAGDQLTEDFVAGTIGGTWRVESWSATGRAELRRGSRAHRWGVTLGGVRQLGEGRSLGGRLIATTADDDRGVSTRTIEASGAVAIRPAVSAWSVLDRFDYREDAVTNAIAGALGPVGGERLKVTGDARSRRLINSLSVNWTPTGSRAGERLERGELQMFVGTRYNFQRYDAFEIGGFSLLAGADAEIDVTGRLSIGGQASVRTGTGGRTVAFAAGPRLTLTPVAGTAVTVGYNVAGFRDRDFEEARATRQGMFVTARIKFDADSLAGLFGR